ERESDSLGQEYVDLDELPHHQRRYHHLERQIEDVDHVGEQPGGGVLFEREIDALGRLSLPADAAVGVPQVDAQSLGLVQLGGGQQEERLPVEARFGLTATQVAQEHIPVDATLRADRISFQRTEEFLAAGQASVQQIGVAVAPGQEVTVALNTRG